MSRTAALPETLTKKWDIANRIAEVTNNKKFKWEKQETAEDAPAVFHLSGLPENVTAIYQDGNDGKQPKGFRLVKGKRTVAGPTLNVGIFLRDLKPIMNEVLEPAAQEA